MQMKLTIWFIHYSIIISESVIRLINNININKHIQLNLVNYIVNVILCDISEVICTYYVAMYN